LFSDNKQPVFKAHFFAFAWGVWSNTPNFR